MPIKGLTDQQASFPRIGELRKGEPKPTQGNRPGSDLQYFRFTSNSTEALTAFERAYGDTPNDIDVFFPYATAAENFEAWQEAWVAGGLQHRCDGEFVVLHQVNGQYFQPQYGAVKCPGGCKQSGSLKVIVPALGRLAYVKAGTTSKNDIIELHANLTAYEALRGDLRGIPFILSRVPRMISTPGKDGKRMRREKWLLHIEAAPEWVQAQLTVMQRAALPSVADAPMLVSTIDNDTGEIVDGDEFADPVTENHLIIKRKAFHATGKETYGDEWDDKRPQLVKYITDFKSTSSNDLTAEQLQTLINGMKEKQAA